MMTNSKPQSPSKFLGIFLAQISLLSLYAVVDMKVFEEMLIKDAYRGVMIGTMCKLGKLGIG